MNELEIKRMAYLAAYTAHWNNLAAKGELGKDFNPQAAAERLAERAIALSA